MVDLGDVDEIADEVNFCVSLIQSRHFKPKEVGQTEPAAVTMSLEKSVRHTQQSRNNIQHNTPWPLVSPRHGAVV